MPAVVPRGRGRPKRGSGKVNGPIKVVKPQAPVRRSTRGKAATTGHVDEDGDGEVQADEIEADKYAFNRILLSREKFSVPRLPNGLLSLSKAMHLQPRMLHPPSILLGKSSVR